MGYVHKIYGYRYNWHNDMYEIDIVLKGTLEFFRGGTKHILHTDDMIVVNPGVGHASYPLEPDTQALVLRLSSRALNDFTPRKHLREFSFASNEENRNSKADGYYAIMRRRLSVPCETDAQNLPIET